MLEIQSLLYLAPAPTIILYFIVDEESGVAFFVNILFLNQITYHLSLRCLVHLPTLHSPEHIILAVFGTSTNSGKFGYDLFLGHFSLEFRSCSDDFDLFISGGGDVRELIIIGHWDEVYLSGVTSRVIRYGNLGALDGV